MDPFAQVLQNMRNLVDEAFNKVLCPDLSNLVKDFKRPNTVDNMMEHFGNNIITFDNFNLIIDDTLINHTQEVLREHCKDIQYINIIVRDNYIYETDAGEETIFMSARVTKETYPEGNGFLINLNEQLFYDLGWDEIPSLHMYNQESGQEYYNFGV